jgi:hypothetical protein
MIWIDLLEKLCIDHDPTINVKFHKLALLRDEHVPPVLTMMAAYQGDEFLAF